MLLPETRKSNAHRINFIRGEDHGNTRASAYCAIGGSSLGTRPTISARSRSLESCAQQVRSGAPTGWLHVREGQNSAARGACCHLSAFARPSRDPDAKLTDFGVSRERVDRTTAAFGTCLWISPKVIIGERYDDKADIFSFGIVLSQLNTHSIPYAHAKSRDGSGARMPDTAVLQLVAARRPRADFSQGGPDSLMQLGIACIVVDAKARPSDRTLLDENVAMYSCHTSQIVPRAHLGFSVTLWRRGHGCAMQLLAICLPLGRIANPTLPILTVGPPTASASKAEAKKTYKRPQCKHEGCTNQVKSKGLCKSHGGGIRCKVDGCDRSAQKAGLCYTHGGKACSVEGCEKSAQRKGLCYAHGGKPSAAKRCTVAGCLMVARTRNLCRAHGGGAQCEVEGCEKVAEPGGRCGAHGGGKRCKEEGCTKRRVSKGLCWDHGGGTRCKLEWCENRAGKSGFCSAHWAEKRGTAMPGNASPDDDWSIDSEGDVIALNCVASTTGRHTTEKRSGSAASVVLKEKGDKPSGVVARTADDAKGVT